MDDRAKEPSAQSSPRGGTGRGFGPASMGALQPGATFAGDFRVLGPLSAGGMGAVYVVEQLSTGRQRALKLMLPQLVADPKSFARFEQEASIGSRIESEHVVEVVGAGVDQASGAPWLAMELLRGEDLASLVRRTGPLPAASMLEIVEQLCHAVGAAHRASIVHRDLKPENVFIAETRRTGTSCMVKVLDFGIAKVVAEARATDTAAIGSPMWMAPEQTARGGFVGPPTDVWSIALIVFHLLTARFFWRAAEDPQATVGQLLREIALDPMPPASRRAAEMGLAAALPPGFDAWFARSTDRSPSARFPDAGAQWQALEALGAGSAVGLALTAPATEIALPATLPPTGLSVASDRVRTTAGLEQNLPEAPGFVSHPPPKRRGLRVGVVIAVAVAAVCLAFAGILVARRGPPEQAAVPTLPPASPPPGQEPIEERLGRALDALFAGAYEKKTVAECRQAYQTSRDLLPQARRAATEPSDVVKFGPAKVRMYGPMCLAKAGDCAQAWTVYKEAWAADPMVSHTVDDEGLRVGFDAITNRSCAGK